MKSIIIFSSILLFLNSCQQNSENTKESADKESEKIENKEIGPITIVIHGGAGTITKAKMTPEKEAQLDSTITLALNSGYAVLEKGGTSIEAVLTSIQIMEESPLFNAGIGAVFTNEGKNELDASIMDGSNGKAGAVAGVSHIKSPILAAHLVMTKSPHVMMTGTGAEKFAKENGLEIVEPSYFFTQRRFDYLQKVKKEEAKKNPDSKYGTVGVLALDQNGNLAAGTSTGGMTNKKYGRVGDSPVIGAGTYAENSSCAVSATGHGEFFIRNVVAYDIAAKMKYQSKSVVDASKEVINHLKEIGGDGGVICLDRKGNIAMPFNTPGMYRGYKREKNEVYIKIYDQNEKDFYLSKTK